jgi:hypothetical protein
MITTFTIGEVAERLHKSRRWPQDFLRATPCGSDGRPFYRLAGRTKLFTADDISRIFEALPSPSNSAVRSQPIRRRGARSSAVPVDALSEALRLASEKKTCRR